MPVISLPFVGQAFKERSVQLNAQDCVNLYVARSPTAEDPNRLALYPTPGYQLLQDLTQLGIPGCGAVRGLFEVNGTVYVVSGTRLLKATPAGNAFAYSAVGTLLTSAGLCSLVSNTVDLAVADGRYGYSLKLATDAFTQVTGGEWPTDKGVTNLAFQDSLVVAAVQGTSKLVQSAVLDAASYPALNAASVASFPDALTAVYSDGRQLYCFGPKQAEVRYNTGSPRFSFEKVQGAFIEAGCASPQTIVKLGGSLVFLAADEKGAAYLAALDGYTPRRLSSPALNEAIQRYATVADAYAWGYREGDATFYCITFPSQNATWAVETGTGLAHRREHRGGADLPTCCVAYRDKQLVGGADGKLYWMSQDHLTGSDGLGLRRSRTCSHLGGGETLFVQDVEIDFETGFAPVGSTPLATLEISTDRGATWQSCGTQPLGQTGETDKRVIWRGVGYGRTLTFRVTVTDPVRVFLTGGRMRVRQGYK